ncbi:MULTISPECIES: hypothetical protein [Bradyrhizobium]
MIAEYRIDRIRRRVIAIRAKKGCDFIIFTANISLGPDEAKRLEYHDVSIVNDREAGERIVEIEVRGKRGVYYCKSMPSMPLRPSCGSVRETRPSRPPLVPEQPVFPLNSILEKQELKFDRGEAPRGLQSAAHVHLLAADGRCRQNCRASVEMIEKYYYFAHKKSAERSGNQPQTCFPT